MLLLLLHTRKQLFALSLPFLLHPILVHTALFRMRPHHFARPAPDRRRW
jgi:hypothetical protein